MSNRKTFDETISLLHNSIKSKETKLREELIRKNSIYKAKIKQNIQKYKNKKYQERLNQNKNLEIKKTNTMEKIREKQSKKKNIKNEIERNIDSKLKEINEKINNITNIELKKKLLKEYFENINLSNLEQRNINKFFRYVNLKKKYLQKKSLNVNYVNETVEKSFILPNKNSSIDLFEYFGINKLQQYTEDEKKEIFNNLMKYLFNINESLKDTDYFIKDIYMLKINEILVKKQFKHEYPKTIFIDKGSWGKVFENSNLMYKYEHLRYYKSLNTNYKNRETYGHLSYVPSIILISFVIENYLNTLNNDYAPSVLNINFSYNNNLGLTIMDKAFKKNGKNFTIFMYIMNEKDRTTFVRDFLTILDKLCDILIFYQRKCCFVHFDLHLANILIDYNYDTNNNLTFSLKLIDFGLSSIVVYDKNDGEYKLLKYINLISYKNPDIVNPLKSTLWNKLDILYFITFLLLNYNIMKFNERSNGTNESEEKLSEKYIKSRNIHELNTKICEIFDIDNNYLTNFNEIKNNSGRSINDIKKVFFILQNNAFRKKIYGENFNINICDPIKLKIKL